MIGERIKQARIAAGMTQDEVVQALSTTSTSLTKGGLSKYERGGSRPKPTMLRALATVLGVQTSYFLSEPGVTVHWQAFRKASRLGKKRRERVRVLAEAQVDVYLSLQRALEPKTDPKEMPHCKKVVTPEDAELAAVSLREYWRFGEQPIESVTAAIEDGGGVVVESGGDEDLFDGLSGWANGTVPVVVVSWAVSDDRRRFSLAHELGHLFMDIGDIDEKTGEQLAHRFAAAFIVTASTARRELGQKRRHLDLRELALLKQKHGLSMQAWILRAADLAIINRAHAGTLFAEMSRRGWRREEPVEFNGRERPRKLRQLTVRALAEGLISRSQAERLSPGITKDAMEEEPVGPLDARTLARLPSSERDRLMEQAASLIADEYKDNRALAGIDTLSEEDHFDKSFKD
jgi:Zn-dependent peptidase ImmA (M78 family)/DNA-binding XRE family transcriptional regulator